MNDDNDKIANVVEELNKYNAKLHLTEVGNIQILQFGESEDENGNAKKWFKAKFKSGSTYLFTDESYVLLMLKTAKAISETDNETVQTLVSEAVDRWLKANTQDNLQLDEAEDGDEKVDNDVKQAVKQRDDSSLTKVTIVDNDLSEKKLIEKAKSIFNKFIDSIYTDDLTAVLPVEWNAQLNEMFMSIVKSDGSFAKNDIPTNDCVEVLTVIGKLPTAFVRTGFASNLKMNEWQAAFSPISWSGIKCKSSPLSIDELEDDKHSIDNLEEILKKAAEDTTKDDLESDDDTPNEDVSAEEDSIEQDEQ